jgi:hypothetical protein
VCNRAAQIQQHDASRVAVTLFSNQFRLSRARSKDLVKGFAAMQASAIQHTFMMKANLGSFERFASSHSSCFGRVSELFVESKCALERPQQGLDEVCTLLLHLFTAPSAHHRYRTVLFSCIPPCVLKTS